MKYIKSTDRESVLKEHIYSFIDSKLQFIDYQINTIVKSFDVDDSTSIAHQQQKQEEEEANRHFIFSLRYEKMLKSIEGYTKMKAKLLVIRTKLNKYNAERSFDLLTDNKYMYYSEKLLTNILNKLTSEKQEPA